MKLKDVIDESGFLTQGGKNLLVSFRGEVRELIELLEEEGLLTDAQLLLVGSVLSKTVCDIISNRREMNNASLAEMPEIIDFSTTKRNPYVQRTSEARPSARRHHCTACGISHSGASSCDAANACSTCAGDGKVIPFRSVEDYPETEANPCPRCEGTGLTERYRRWRAGERMNEATPEREPKLLPLALALMASLPEELKLTPEYEALANEINETTPRVYPCSTEAPPNNDLLSKAKRYLNRWFNNDASPFHTEWKDHDAEVQELVDMLRPAQAPKDK